jgi:hypothetical protein
MDAVRGTSYAMTLIATGTVMRLGCVNKLIILSPSAATVSKKRDWSKANCKGEWMSGDEAQIFKMRNRIGPCMRHHRCRHITIIITTTTISVSSKCRILVPLHEYWERSWQKVTPASFPVIVSSSEAPTRLTMYNQWSLEDINQRKETIRFKDHI